MPAAAAAPGGEEGDRGREKLAVLYGKQCRFLDDVPGARAAVRLLLARGWRVVDTLDGEEASSGACRPEATEHLGVLPQAQVLALLRRARLLLGLGKPLLGMMPLEALAAGAAVLLPRYDAPRACSDDADVNAIPSACAPDAPKWTSQHPALEALAERAAYSASGPAPAPAPRLAFLNFADAEAVGEAADALAALPDAAFAPAPSGLLDDFTAEAFLLRVAALARDMSAVAAAPAHKGAAAPEPATSPRMH
jgi:hypothetical protein